MSQADPGPLPPRRRRIRWQWWLLAAVFVAGAAFLAHWAYQSYSDEQRLAAVITELDRSDPGWRWDDIEAGRRRVVEDENGASVLVKADVLLPGPWPNSTFYRKFDATGDYDLTVHPAAILDEATTALLRTELATKKHALVEARRMAEFAHGKYPTRLARNPIMTLLPHVDFTRRFAHLLEYDAFLRIQDGDAEGAAGSVRAMIGVGRSLGDEPFLVTALSRFAITSMAVRATERILAQGEASDASLAQVQEMLSKEEVEPLLVNALRGERATHDILCQAIQSGDVPWQQVRGIFGTVKGTAKGTPKTGWTWLDDALTWWGEESISSMAKGRAALLEFDTQSIAIAREPLHTQDSLARDLEKDAARLSMPARALIPANTKLLTANRRSVAELRCAIAAIAAERFRLANGRWPETLAELTPKFLAQVPLDPFDGAPLRFRKTEEGVLIYSVGPDDIDDGGKLDRTKSPMVPGTDMGFRLFDVTKRRQPPVPRPTEE